MPASTISAAPGSFQTQRWSLVDSNVSVLCDNFGAISLQSHHTLIRVTWVWPKVA